MSHVATMARAHGIPAVLGAPHDEASLRSARVVALDGSSGEIVLDPVFLAAEFAREIDFFSVGTNDLTQYVMAADRLNPRVAKLNRTEHPAVLAAIHMAAEAARKAGIWIGVCGKAAARPDLIPFFVANGVSELSMSPASIPRAKKCVTEI